MHPFIDIFGFQLPVYGMLALAAFGISLLVAIQFAKIYGLPRPDLLFASVYMVIGIIIGSKLMFFLTYIPKLIKNFDVFLQYPWETLMLVFSGYVFYGGLIGGAVGILVYSKQFKLKPMVFADVISPVIPLFHSIGRIGCFFGGCCYGVEYDGPFSVHFPYNELVPELSQVDRFPVQLMESGLNFILFIGLAIYSRKRRKSGVTLGIYIIAYTVIRTFTELFRGDIGRGVYGGGISTSQIISLVLLPLGIWLILRKNKKVTA